MIGLTPTGRGCTADLLKRRQQIARFGVQCRRASDLVYEAAEGVFIITNGANLAFLAKGPWDETLWSLEDQELLQAIDQHIADLLAREQATAEASRT